MMRLVFCLLLLLAISRRCWYGVIAIQLCVDEIDVSFDGVNSTNLIH